VAKTYEITNEGAEIDFEIPPEYEETRILQNVHNLLMTRKGEVPFDRERGFDHGIYDLPAERAEEELVPECVRVLLWEPRATLIDASGEWKEDGTMKITARISIETGEEAEET